MESLIEKAKKIRLLTFDVDGVLTAGGMHYGKEGIESKHFHVHDGQGIRHLLQTGVNIAVITACKSPIVKRRMEDLGITHIYQAQSDKKMAYENLKEKLQLSDEEIAYAGDDFPDLPILNRVGLAITVANAPKIMQQYVHWTTKNKGGKGAAREICDFIMQAQGTYQSILDFYLAR
ncbi:MAG: kdsC [Gammaproteobacteria bacterium]|jgi:3-deoxy-D-manno-octulosonate 8-phosphate phosphatase (KDO 8-P phosphatase)|nr:kdsC [Gammaproteobacteria bacterium]